MHEVMVKGILSSQNGMNVYRGCTHGCIYCDARSHCYQINHEFTDIEIKKNAPELLEDALKRKRYKCMIGTGAMVWLSPILPYINDTEENIRGLLSYCMEAKVQGIICFDMGLTLRDGNREYFYEQLKKKFPGLTGKYVKEYGNSYGICSPKNIQLMKLFRNFCKENKILYNTKECFEYLQEYESKEGPKQMELGDYFSL